MEKHSIDYIRNCFSYCDETGVVSWRRRTDRAKNWNTRFASKPFGRISHEGYIVGHLDGKTLQCSHIAWALKYGKWPSKSLDHINGKKTDNRINNLRDVGHHEQGKNLPIGSRNKTGVIGVHRRKKDGLFIAQIRQNQKTSHIGVFNCITAAMIARKLEEKRRGFSVNHGRASSS